MEDIRVRRRESENAIFLVRIKFKKEKNVIIEFIHIPENVFQEFSEMI